MVFILNQNLKGDKLLRKELTEIYGINDFLANQICDQLGLSSRITVAQLTTVQVDKLTRIVNHYYITGPELKRLMNKDLQRFVTVGAYKGLRYSQGLPLRGQRTHTNAKNSRRRSRL